MDWQSEALEPLRRQMVQFATLQLDDAAAAEDAVQEAIAAAMRHAASFAGRSALKTWVFAILKNKIRDELRRRARLVPLSGSGGRDEEEEPLTELFDRRGHWLPEARPQAWGDPEAVENDRQFWAFALRSARTAAERYREVGVAFPSVEVLGLSPVRDARRQFGPVGESVREGQRRTACV